MTGVPEEVTCRRRRLLWWTWIAHCWHKLPPTYVEHPRTGHGEFIQLLPWVEHIAHFKCCQCGTEKSRTVEY